MDLQVRQETFWQRQRRMLPFSPFQCMLLLTNADYEIAAWLAFSLSLLLNVLDFSLKCKYGEPHAYFPSIINTSSLLAYIVLLIVYYRTQTEFDSRYIGPIVASFLTCAVLFSMLFQWPLTLEFTKRLVDEPLRSSREFMRFNEWLTAYVLFWFVVMLTLTWCGTLFDKRSWQQILLGIALPILIPFVIQFTSPLVAKWLMSFRRNSRTATHQAQDRLEEATPLVIKPVQQQQHVE